MSWTLWSNLPGNHVCILVLESKEIGLNWNAVSRSPQMLQPHLKGGVESGDYVRIGPILGGISPTFSPTHKFEFISVWYKWRLIKQSNVNHYLAPCGKIEYLLDCIPCGRSPPWPRPYHGPFFLVLFIVCRRTCWVTFLANVSGQAREQPELLWPKRNSSVTQCSATDTKLDNNWKCQQGLICPFNWAFQRSHSTCMQA